MDIYYVYNITKWREYEYDNIKYAYDFYASYLNTSYVKYTYNKWELKLKH